jgi:hypothetical protein
MKPKQIAAGFLNRVSQVRFLPGALITPSDLRARWVRGALRPVSPGDPRPPRTEPVASSLAGRGDPSVRASFASLGVPHHLPTYPMHEGPEAELWTVGHSIDTGTRVDPRSTCRHRALACQETSIFEMTSLEAFAVFDPCL